jgi:ribosomal protein S18 acetylase RimI-like enzyme
MNLSIRKADLEDTPGIQEILTAAVQFKLDHGDNSWGSEPYSEREVRGLIKTGGTYVAFAGDEMVATFGLHWNDERIWGSQAADAGYIHRLATKDGWHGKGIGKEIISWASAEVAGNNRHYLRLDCDSKNVSLCGYYEKLGFKETGKKLIKPYKDYYATLYERPI